MKIHLQTEIDKLTKKLFHLSTLVEESLELAIKAVHDQDLELAATIKERDKEIDRTEVDIEEDCLKILALHQPVAADLRFLITVLKMNNDLERIGDLAVNISKGKPCLVEGSSPLVFGERLKDLGDKAQLMLRNSLQALLDLNVEGARQVLAADDEVDADYKNFTDLIKAQLGGNKEQTDLMVTWVMIAKHIERVADLATNIAEDTIYTVTGEIVRHGNC